MARRRSVSISEIKRAAYNPRIDLTPDDPEYQALARSIDEFGLVQPLVWNEQTGNLVGGHQRLTVLLDKEPRKEKFAIGREITVVNLDLDREKQLNIALNKVDGRWDEQKLATLIFELYGSEGADTGAAIGLSDAEIKAGLKYYQELTKDEPEEEERAPTEFSPHSPESVRTKSTCPRCKFEF